MYKKLFLRILLGAFLYTFFVGKFLFILVVNYIVNLLF